MKTIIATFALIALAGPAFAQVKYTDDKGQTHYVGSIEQVPAQYRPKPPAPERDYRSDEERCRLNLSAPAPLRDGRVQSLAQCLGLDEGGK